MWNQYIKQRRSAPSPNIVNIMHMEVRIGELYYIVYRSWGLEAGDAAQPWHSWQLRHGRDTDRAEVGTAESSRAQPRHPHHPPHTPTPGTLSIYTFRWLLLRCIFIALAKVNKCNQLDLNPNPFLPVTFLKKWKRKFRRIFITQLCNLNIEVNVIIVVG